MKQLWIDFTVMSRVSSMHRRCLTLDLSEFLTPDQYDEVKDMDESDIQDFLNDLLYDKDISFTNDVLLREIAESYVDGVEDEEDVIDDLWVDSWEPSDDEDEDEEDD